MRDDKFEVLVCKETTIGRSDSEFATTIPLHSTYGPGTFQIPVGFNQLRLFGTITDVNSIFTSGQLNVNIYSKADANHLIAQYIYTNAGAFSEKLDVQGVKKLLIGIDFNHPDSDLEHLSLMAVIG